MILDPVTGDELIDINELAPLLGITAEEIREEFPPGFTGKRPIPHHWIQSGRRRAREYAAATGRSDMQGAIAYWQERDAIGGAP